MTELKQTARYLAETLDRERVYRAYWRNTLTSAISEIVFHDPPIVTWQIVDHHDDGRVVAGDASFSTSVLEAAKRRAAQADDGDGDIVQDDPDTQRIEQQMWDTARALQQVQDNEQMLTRSPAPYILLHIRYSDCVGLASWVSIRAGTIGNAIDIYAELLNSNTRRVLFWSITDNGGAELMKNTIPYEAYDDENAFPYRDQQIQQMREQAHAIEQQPTPPGYRRGLTEAEARAHALQQAPADEDQCPPLSTGTALIAIGGRADEGAWHRAVTLTNKLIAAGRWDWRPGNTSIWITSPYESDTLDIDEIYEDVHYQIGGAAPMTEAEMIVHRRFMDSMVLVHSTDEDEQQPTPSPAPDVFVIRGYDQHGEVVRVFMTVTEAEARGCIPLMISEGLRWEIEWSDGPYTHILKAKPDIPF